MLVSNFFFVLNLPQEICPDGKFDGGSNIFFFQNRFWPLEKLFLLIGAWGSLKKSHFRGLYSELFRPNGGVLDCFLAAQNSLRVYLKLVRATFSIYCVILEKSFQKNFCLKMYQIASLFNFSSSKVKQFGTFWDKKFLKIFFSKITK